MLRGGLLLGFGNISLALLGLVRNAFIARMISVQDFGIGSSFIITLIVLKALSDLGLYRLIIQAPDGDEPRVMSTLHAVHACRGLIGAVTLFLAGGTVARYFGVPEATWAYRSLGILVLLEGCVHFDIYRLQRKLIFLPGVAADGGGLLISIVAVAPFVAIFHDYRAVLFIVITHQFSFVVMSHLFARRPYRFAWDREIVRRVFSFGGPLLIASLLIIITSNANRVIVGGMIGLTVLAWFGMATSLTMMASDFANKSLTSFFMPLLSNAQNEPATFRKLHVLTMQSGMLIGIGSTIGVALFGPLLVNILYGQRYADALTVIVWLAVMYGLRSAAGAASTIAISGANTKIPLVANVMRLLIVPVMWIAVVNGFGVPAVVALSILGEALSLAVSALLLRLWLDLPLAGLSLTALPSFATLILIATIYSSHLSGTASHGYLVAQYLLLAGAIVLVVLNMAPLRRFVLSMGRDIS
jgi:O-antigen/teichoic acid export membrane protein